MDFWTSRVNTSYLGVTCHYINNWKLHSRVLETLKMTESHTSKNIMELISTVFNTWCIANKICAIVCDNAPNMVKGVQNINQGLLVRCAVHSIQLSINIGLNNGEIKDLINKLRSFVGHFHRSAVSQSNLE